MPPRLRSHALILVAAALLASACTTASAVEEDAERGPGSTTSAEAVTTTTAGSSTTTSSTTTSSTTSTTTTTTTLPPITLAFAGDTSFTYGLHERDPFGEITELLSAPDFTAVNLETTVAEAGVGTAAPKRFTFKSPPSSLSLIQEAGIDFVQLANNHTLDFGRPAILRTLELLDAASIPYAGAGPGPTEAYAPRFVDVNGWRIGIVAFSRVPCDWSASGENTRPEVAWTCDPFVLDTLASVEAAAAEADLVVVMVHWGIELDNCPQPFQRQLATAWMDLGADIVIGGHPHVLQGVERIGDGWLVNSTGNFAFPSARGASARTAVFEFTVSDESITLTAHPVVVSNGRPAPAPPDAAASILSDLTRWSFGVAFDGAGVATASGEAGACG